jgi:hypothetical protein
VEVIAMSRACVVPRALLALLALALWGCPYESDKPIGDPKTAVSEERLLGEWHCVTPEDERVSKLSVSAGAEGLPELWFSTDTEKSRMQFFVTQLPEGRVMSVRELEDGKPKGSWSIARYTFHRPYLLEFELAEDEAFKGATDPVPVVRRGLTSPGVFVPGIVCVRPPADEKP